MVFEKIRQLLAEQFGVEENTITMETSFTDDLNADSLDIVELIMVIEEEFEITINDDDVENVKTVGDVVNYITEVCG